MSRSTPFHRTTFLALLVIAVLVMSAAGTARAGVCKQNGAQCQTGVSCCQRNCVKPVVVSFCGAKGPGNCGTTPCISCTTNEPCLDPG